MLEKLKLLLQAGNPIISLETRDEGAAVDLVSRAAEQLGRPYFEWSATRGLVQIIADSPPKEMRQDKAQSALEFVLGDSKEKGIYLFKDLGPHCKEPIVMRQLRDLYCRNEGRLVLVEGNPLPDTIRRLTVPLALPLPDSAELEKLVRSTFRRIRDAGFNEVRIDLTKRELEQIVHTLRGLTAPEATRVVAAAIHDDDALTGEDIPRIVEGKKNLLESAGCLETVNINFTPDEIGGLANLKRWLARRRRGMTAEARAYNLDAPRGILLLGVQGCGKSLCAKVVAADWQMPLLRMDPGVLYQKYIGESENRLREALAQAESMAPAILWIDEIEKAFASAAAESSDGGLSQRMFGTLLSWMQDHRSPLFMVATANNISALPPELMRKGRFDEVFFVDLPNAEARRQVLQIHLQRRKRNPALFHLDALVQATDGFSGAELEQLLIAGMYAAFADGVEVDDEYLLAEAAATRPLSVMMGERVAQLRKWADGRCVPAD